MNATAPQQGKRTGKWHGLTPLSAIILRQTLENHYSS